jgi:predicted MFS family arabinose efflux permease
MALVQVPVTADRAVRHLPWLGFLPWYYGWTIVAASCVAVGIGMGARAVAGVLLATLFETYDWGRAATAGALSVSFVVSTLTAPWWGALLDRWGPRRMFATAALVGGTGLAVAATTQELWHLYLGLGLLGGVGLAPFWATTFGVVISNWFVQRRGLAIGIVAAGSGLGILLLAPLMQGIIGVASWRGAFLALGALLMGVVAPLALVVLRRTPEECGWAPDGARAAPPSLSISGPTVSQALRNGRYWLLVVGFPLGIAGHQFILAHGVAYLLDRGFSADLVALALGLFGGCTVAGMVLWGYLGDRLGGEWAYVVGSLALIASIGLLYWVVPGREPLLWLFAVVFAVGYGSRQGLHAFIAAKLLQGRSFGALMGSMTAALSVGSALGPAMGGWVFDFTGGYDLALTLAGLCTAVAAVCIWLAAPGRGRLISDNLGASTTLRMDAANWSRPALARDE